MVITLEKLTAEVDELPTLPHITAMVMEITSSTNTTAQELNDVIIQDQALAAKILKLANSAYYGFSRRISTITEAIIMLGFINIRNLVLASNVHSIIPDEIPGYNLGKGELWEHSLATAMTAGKLAKKIGYPEADKAYICGLLHDIGKTILNHYVKEGYDEILAKADNGTPFEIAEEEVLGYNHSQVGAKVAEKWNFPVDLVEVIRWHHEPTKAEGNKKLCTIVHLADALTVMMGLGMGIDGFLEPIAEGEITKMGFTQKVIDDVISEITDYFTIDPKIE